MNRNKVDEAFEGLIDFFRQRNHAWFLEVFWGEIRERLRMMADDALRLCPPDGTTRVLDVGCHVGFASYVFAVLGYRVTASDQEDHPERRALLNSYETTFHQANFNRLGALEDLPEASFDLVWMGEVIEHVLNHPLGLMKAVRRAMKPDGLLILTTPNAANFMHMYRLFRGLSYIRDTEAFMSEPKFDAQGHIISHPGIHYHEYVPAEIDDLLRMAGFRLQERRYLPVGSSGGQPLLKRLVKQAYPTRRLLHTRLFGATQYCLARPAPPA